MEKNIRYQTEKNGVPNPANKTHTTLIKGLFKSYFNSSCIYLIYILINKVSEKLVNNVQKLKNNR